MKWIRIPKENSSQPSKGSYSDWKGIIAKEGQHQCVYCAINDAIFGGTRNFHVEHFRPKSLPQFKDLRNDIRNLYYACPICNTFKSDDWPCDPTDDLSIHCYPDPSQVDYNTLFKLDISTGLVEGQYEATKYVVERIYLNRPQLIMERRIHYLFLLEESLIVEITAVLKFAKEEKALPLDLLVELYDRLNDLSIEFRAMNAQLRGITPYEDSDVERPTTKRSRSPKHKKYSTEPAVGKHQRRLRKQIDSDT